MPMPKSIKNPQNDSTIPMSSERLTVADMIARSNDPAFREEIRLRKEAMTFLRLFRSHPDGAKTNSVKTALGIAVSPAPRRMS